MKLKKPILATIGALTAFAVIAGPLALARKDSDPRVVAPTPRVLTATEQVSKDRDIRPTGSSLGDEFVLSQSLTEGGVAVGTADTSCTFVRVVREDGKATPLAISLQCTGVAEIGPDLLLFQGVNSFSPTSPSVSRFVVTGGTGKFRDARGEVRVTETGKGTSAIALDLA
ncbi:hypothetical protein GCM10009547_46060 [Sporichthya brevicatena]|uniref:Dirigent protein n=1 Tax=Sporichthya brevicatena TaxID=171442 RepID=A0ABN1HBD2_9ACTN